MKPAQAPRASAAGAASDTEPVLALRRSARSWALAYAAVALAGGALVAAAVTGVTLPVPLGVPLAAGIALGLLAALHAAVLLWAAQARYRVFRSAIELRTGLLSRRIENVQMFRVRDLGLEQGLLDRVLGVGDVIVTSTDESRKRLVLRGVRDPLHVYDTLRAVLAASQATRQTMIVENEPPPSANPR